MKNSYLDFLGNMRSERVVDFQTAGTTQNHCYAKVQNLLLGRLHPDKQSEQSVSMYCSMSLPQDIPLVESQPQALSIHGQLMVQTQL